MQHLYYGSLAAMVTDNLISLLEKHKTVAFESTLY